MKSVLIIGMGKFGHHLCENLLKQDVEVMVIDQNEDTIQDLLSSVTKVKIGDCTKEEVLRSLGVSNFDICFVCIGSNFQSSLEITSLLKELNAPYVVSLTNRNVHAKFLLRNGADEVIYPDRDIAEKVAVKYSADHVFDYIELTEEYSIYELPVLKQWVGKSIKEAAIRTEYHVNILGFKKDGEPQFLPGPDHVFTADEHIMVLGQKNEIEKILKKL